MTKNCTYCKKDKPLDNFSRHPTARFGRKHICRDCDKVYSRNRYTKLLKSLGRRRRIAVGGNVRTCNHRKGDVRDDGMVFWSKRKNANGFQEWWMTRADFEKRKKQANDRNKWRYHNDPQLRKKARAKNSTEKIRALKRRWNHAHREYMILYQAQRRAKLRGDSISLNSEEKKRIRDWYKFRSILNSKHGKAMFHVDHKQPISRGGRHHPDNIRVTTAEYNVRKFVNKAPTEKGALQTTKRAGGY